MGNFMDSYGKRIYVHFWETENPIGVIQIIHGMAEHAKRYSDFAQYLNNKGYSVFAIDHRGHGKTKSPGENYGEIGENGFEMMVEDQFKLTSVLKKKYPSKPIIIFGHSMGSFLAQRFTQKYGDNVSALILSGSSSSFGLSLYLGKIVASLLMKLSSKESKFLQNLTFYNYNEKTDKKFEFSWLTRDNFKVKQYIEDEACGNIYPASFFFYFYQALINIYKTENIKLIPKKIPLFIFSGDMDPVGGYGDRVEKLHKMYSKLGYNVETKLYTGGRHEMLNELNKDEVYRDFVDFIKRKVNFSPKMGA